LDIIEANNPTLAFNLFLAPADKNDEIITKRKRVAKGGNVGGRLVPEDLKGKFVSSSS